MCEESVNTFVWKSLHCCPEIYAQHEVLSPILNTLIMMIDPTFKICKQHFQVQCSNLPFSYPRQLYEYKYKHISKEIYKQVDEDQMVSMPWCWNFPDLVNRKTNGRIHVWPVQVLAPCKRVTAYLILLTNPSRSDWASDARTIEHDATLNCHEWLWNPLKNIHFVWILSCGIIEQLSYLLRSCLSFFLIFFEPSEEWTSACHCAASGFWLAEVSYVWQMFRSIKFLLNLLHYTILGKF